MRKLAWIVAFGLLSSHAGAAVVTLDFTGTVDNISDEGVLDGSIGLGTSFQLHVVYDESAPASEVVDTQSRWIFPVPPNQMTLAVGNYLAVTGPLSGDPTLPDAFQVILVDEPAGNGNNDYYLLTASGPVSAGSASLPGSFGLLLGDPTGTALAAPIQLGAVPFDLAAWGLEGEDLTFVLSDSSGAEAAVFGQVEQIAASRVPEPFAAALALAGLAGLFAAAVRVRS